MGLIAAALHTWVKLRLGLPGFSAVMWLVPLLVARIAARGSAAGSIASTTTAVGLYAFRGFSLRWPLVLAFGTYWLVGPVLDLYVQLLQRRFERAGADPASVAARLVVVWVALAGAVGNFAHLGLKVFFGVIRPHGARFGLSPVLFLLLSYLVFGLAAGVVASGVAWPFVRRRRGNRT